VRQERQNAFLSCLAAGILSIQVFCPAAAQDTPDKEESEQNPIEEVIVTGTRIKRPDLSSPSPLVTVDRSDLEFSGQPTLEEYLKQMPQLQPDSGRTDNNGDTTASLNLRGLGAVRTLVLMNGRRLAPNYVGGAVDVDNLPRALIDHVEMITGGASTVYGSDAIAGVVNFITRNDFDGFSLDTTRYVTERGDADIYDVNVLFGHELTNGRGNITAYAGYYERKALLAADREYTRTPLNENLDTGQLEEGGTLVNPAGVVAFPPVNFGQGPVLMTWKSDGAPRAFDFTTDLYNVLLSRYLQVPLTRSTAGLMATLGLGTRWETYLEAAYAHNEARTQHEPIAAVATVVVNTDNPVLTRETRQIFEQQLLVAPGLAGMVLARSLSELGPAQHEISFDYTRVVTGIRGQIAPGWDLDAWITWTKAEFVQKLLNGATLSRLQQGLLVDPATGQCFDSSNGCTPIDLFGPDRLSTAAVEFLRHAPYVHFGDVRQSLASIVVTSAPFEAWAGPVDMSFGAEWRRDKGYAVVDKSLVPEDALGYGAAAPTNGKETVFELYTEALVPLLEHRNGGPYLAAELGYRYSDYDHAGTVSTWKAGLVWRPVDSLLFRGMAQRSVRAPNLFELFREQYQLRGNGYANSSGDPCSASNNPAASGTAGKCVIQGLPADQVGVFEATPFYPATFTVGGNPNLEPESAETLTAGVVVTPARIPGLTLSVDYYDIEVTDTIGNISALDICFDPKNTGDVFCENIQRDSTGNISTIYQPRQNRGLLVTNGIDTQLRYRRDLAPAWALFGDDAEVGVSTNWTHLLSFKSQENITTRILECAGLIGFDCLIRPSKGRPENRVTTHFDYTSGPFAARLTWRWIDGMDSARPLSPGYMLHPDPKLAVPTVPSYSAFDLGFHYRFGKSIEARFGVSNLLDRKPILLPNHLFNTDQVMYDVFGRSYYVSLSWDPGH